MGVYVFQKLFLISTSQSCFATFNQVSFLYLFQRVMWILCMYAPVGKVVKQSRFCEEISRQWNEESGFPDQYPFELEMFFALNCDRFKQTVWIIVTGKKRRVASLKTTKQKTFLTIFIFWNFKRPGIVRRMWCRFKVLKRKLKLEFVGQPFCDFSTLSWFLFRAKIAISTFYKHDIYIQYNSTSCICVF